MEKENKETEVKKESFIKKIIKKLFTKEVILYLVFGVLTTLIKPRSKNRFIKDFVRRETIHSNYKLQYLLHGL